MIKNLSCNLTMYCNDIFLFTSSFALKEYLTWIQPIHPSLQLLAFFIFRTLLLDLISKIASKEERICDCYCFEVPIIVTSISALISVLLRLLFVLTIYTMAGTDTALYTVLLPTTLRWIVTQKIIINLANKYNKLKTSSCLKKICEHRQSQHEDAKLKKKWKYRLII